MKVRKLAAVILAAMLFMSLLAACGGDKTKENSNWSLDGTYESDYGKYVFDGDKYTKYDYDGEEESTGNYGIVKSYILFVDSDGDDDPCSFSQSGNTITIDDYEYTKK